MRVGFYTLGCKLNQCETEALASSIGSKGFSIITGSDAADIYIINTCAVTSKSEQKARRQIRSYANAHPESLIIVTGCYAQVDYAAIASLAANIVVVPIDKKAQLVHAFETANISGQTSLEREGLKKAITESLSGCFGDADKFSFQTDNYKFHSRAFLKIQDGCDGACAYCIVPHARGRAVSLDPQKVLESVAALEKNGYREIVLTGVNISAYNHGGETLPLLLETICKSIGKTRIRLSSVEPDSIDDALCSAIAHPAVCPHFHIPVQSGSDKILSMMKRKYDSTRLRHAMTILAQAKPGSFLGCDIIVGFPGETNEDFESTKEIVTELGFSALHVFQFSARPGTEAQWMKGTVSEGIKKERARKLITLSELLHSKYVRRFEGEKSEAILQQKVVDLQAQCTHWSGITGNYLKVKIRDVPDQGAKRGGLVTIRLDSGFPVSDATFISFL